jgi:hypothetical protein
MPKALCLAGLVVAVLLALIFLLDIILGMPFHRASPWVLDVGVILCAGILGYLSWTTFREQT